jgi:hypothetical protein
MTDKTKPAETIKEQIAEWQGNDARAAAHSVDVGMHEQGQRERRCTRHEPDPDDPIFCRHCGALAPESGLREWPKVHR